MNPEQSDGISVDPQKVSQRAYARVASLTLEVDQWQTAYEALVQDHGVELAKVKAEMEAMRPAQAPTAQPHPVIEVQDPTHVTRD